jgi:MATE family multidrug resistance protein
MSACLSFQLGWQGLGIWVGLAFGIATVAVLVLWRWILRGKLGLMLT